MEREKGTGWKVELVFIFLDSKLNNGGGLEYLGTRYQENGKILESKWGVEYGNRNTPSRFDGYFAQKNLFFYFILFFLFFFSIFLFLFNFFITWVHIAIFPTPPPFNSYQPLNEAHLSTFKSTTYSILVSNWTVTEIQKCGKRKNNFSKSSKWLPNLALIHVMRIYSVQT